MYIYIYIYGTIGVQTYVANWVMERAQTKSFFPHSNKKWSSWKRRAGQT